MKFYEAHGVPLISMKSMEYKIYREQHSPDSPVVQPLAWEPGALLFPVRALQLRHV